MYYLQHVQTETRQQDLVPTDHNKNLRVAITMTTATMAHTGVWQGTGICVLHADYFKRFSEYCTQDCLT